MSSKMIQPGNARPHGCPPTCACRRECQGTEVRSVLPGVRSVCPGTPTPRPLRCDPHMGPGHISIGSVARVSMGVEHSRHTATCRAQTFRPRGCSRPYESLGHVTTRMTRRCGPVGPVGPVGPRVRVRRPGPWPFRGPGTPGPEPGGPGDTPGVGGPRRGGGGQRPGTPVHPWAHGGARSCGQSSDPRGQPRVARIGRTAER